MNILFVSSFCLASFVTWNSPARTHTKSPCCLPHSRRKSLKATRCSTLNLLHTDWLKGSSSAENNRYLRGRRLTWQQLVRRARRRDQDLKGVAGPTVIKTCRGGAGNQAQYYTTKVPHNSQTVAQVQEMGVTAVPLSLRVVWINLSIGLEAGDRQPILML